MFSNYKLDIISINKVPSGRLPADYSAQLSAPSSDPNQLMMAENEGGQSQ